MKPTRTKVLALAIAFILSLVLAACDSGSASPGSPGEPAQSPALTPPAEASQAATSEPPTEENTSGFPSTEPAQPFEDDDSTLANQFIHGFTHEQWQRLEGQKELYGGLTEEEINAAQFNGLIDCAKFLHLHWEHYIDSNLIYHVGVNEFESWLKAIESTHNPDQCNIYNFANHFSITLDELVSFIETNGLTEIYDLETVKRRFAWALE